MGVGKTFAGSSTVFFGGCPHTVESIFDLRSVDLFKLISLGCNTRFLAAWMLSSRCLSVLFCSVTFAQSMLTNWVGHCYTGLLQRDCIRWRVNV